MRLVRRLFDTYVFKLSPQEEAPCPDRRRLLTYIAGAAALPMLSLPELSEAAARKNARLLAFNHTHTGEKLAVVYRVGNNYVPGAITQLQNLSRDFRTGSKHPMDPALFDLLWQVSQDVETSDPFNIISAYRSPQTNRALRGRSKHSGVAEHSLHMTGKAMDVALSDVSLSDLRDAAKDLKLGGVGYYAGEFVHIDTGRVRYW
ncbi:MAG TPA: DUF882 domain-containing protein [Pseudomonadales bacterium]|nr:DUF882 domain-containing protein [Pseudomonadales bacterium]